MKNYLLSASVLLFLLLTTCSKKEVVAKCYNENPIEELGWLKTAVQGFQKPKSGPLTVSAMVFRNEMYFVLTNPYVSSPMSYIFNCQGKTIGQLGIHYNTFIGEAKLFKVFLNQNY